MTLRVGVIGTGMIGREHIKRLTGLSSRCAVVAVSDVNRAAAQSVADDLKNAKVFATGQELISDPGVDAIVVTSLGATHEEYVLAAIAARKPVLCEKPLATTKEACLRIIEAEVAAGRKLVHVGFMRRYDEAYRAMRSTITAGAIGAPLIFHSAHRNPSVPPSYTNEMAINDTAVHDIDVARWLLDDEVTAASVAAPRRNAHGGKLRDPIMIQLEMRGGAVVDIEVSVNIAYGYDIRGEVVGETGVVSLAERNPVVVRSNGTFSGSVPGDWKSRFDGAFDAEFRDWLEAASAGTAYGPNSWDGYAAAVVSDAALEAANTANRVAITMRKRPPLYAKQA